MDGRRNPFRFGCIRFIINNGRIFRHYMIGVRMCGQRLCWLFTRCACVSAQEISLSKTFRTHADFFQLISSYINVYCWTNRILSTSKQHHRPKTRTQNIYIKNVNVWLWLSMPVSPIFISITKFFFSWLSLNNQHFPFKSKKFIRFFSNPFLFLDWQFWMIWNVILPSI